jgi:hypothetical protein
MKSSWTNIENAQVNFPRMGDEGESEKLNDFN